MKIQTSSLNLQSAYNYSEQYERKESLMVKEKLLSKKEESPRTDENHDRINLNEQKRDLRKGLPKNSYFTGSEQKVPTSKVADSKSLEPEDDELSISDMKLRIMKMVLEQITGVEIKIYNRDADGSSDAPETAATQEGGEPAPEREITTTYKLNERYHEQESLSFEGAGQVTTETGETFAFAVSFSQKREFAQETNVSLTSTAKLTDPLVVTFDGTGAKLTDEKVAFDLNADGTAEQISNLKDGSLFLSLDKNNDGKINNGSELFGPSTGSGFGELASHDSDGNGWIDENDPVFYELRLWKPGHESSTLLEKGVGAISLDSVGGSFSLKNEKQELLGAVKNQGVWLQEKTGKAGMIQELDLVA